VFKLENIRFIYPEVAIIDSNYRLLISDDFPILYTGLNKHGSKIIGILVDEDEEQAFVRYFHILVKDEDLSKFFKKAITIRELIENEKTIFVIDKNYNGSIRHKCHNAEESPQQHPLHSSSYIPTNNCHLLL
jgi:hypothetical protein